MKNGEALLVSIELDRTRRLRFDMNALAVLEEHGVNLFDDAALADLERMIKSPSKIRLFAWAGLLHEDSDLTQQAVGAMIAGDAFLPAVRAVAEALKQALPDGDEQEPEGNAPAAARGSRRVGRTSAP